MKLRHYYILLSLLVLNFCFDAYRVKQIQKLQTQDTLITEAVLNVIDVLQIMLEENSPFTPSPTPPWFTPDHNQLLEAIRHVETGNGVMVGDGGRSLGPYQIQYNYWKDAIDHNPLISGTYNDVMNEEYARQIVISYWDRYGHRVNFSLEGLARLNNGGPRGHEKNSTLDYWHKINTILIK